MKKLLSMKKLIFIATMFLISLSANSQIQDVDDKSDWLNITTTKGDKISHPLNGAQLIGWTNTYIVVQTKEYVKVYNSKGDIIKWIQINLKRNNSEPDYKVTAVTPNYFIIRNVDGDRKYNNKGEQFY